MDINEHKQENQTKIAIFVLIANILWFGLGVGLVFARNELRAYNTAILFFFISLLSIPCYGFLAWANVRQQSCRLLRIFRDCTICYVAFSAGLFLFAISAPSSISGVLGGYLLLISLVLIITTNLLGYIIIIYIQNKLVFTLYVVTQTVSMFSVATFSYLASEIAAAC
ncbi:MAG: hypothetical protein LBC02_07810 [Planctomycetaceae bacterium]|jgi:hypothetical protein|nr:hypothetical protein [Planctomycetaceae bacterium]